MGDLHEQLLRDLLSRVVPGSSLRDGLDRILHAHMGALIVLGDDPDVLGVSSGGFHIDAEMTPQRLSELAKMDGAMVLKADGTRIVWANVQLLPDPATPTVETGTRHRTAERVARSLDVPVIAVSEEMGTITIYRGPARRQLETSIALFGRANHLLQILERFKSRFNEVNAALAVAEFEGSVTVGEVATVVQRATMVVRVTEEITELIGELGSYGRLLSVQLDELVVGMDDELRLVLADYLDPSAASSADEALGRLEELSTDELLDLDHLLSLVITDPGADGLDARVSPRGLRLLRQLPGLTNESIELLVGHFGDLRRLMRAPASTLARVASIEVEKARAIKSGITTLAEAASVKALSDSSAGALAR